MVSSLTTVESESRNTFVPMKITGQVTFVEGAIVLVSSHTQLDGINPAGSCDSVTGRLVFEQHGEIKDVYGERMPNFIPVVVCSRGDCDARAFPPA